MSTKAELVAKIQELEALIGEQQKAIKKLANDNGVDVSLPHAPHGMKIPLMMDDDEHVCHDEIARIVFEAISEDGIPSGWPIGAFAKNSLDFRDWHGGKSYVIPLLAGKIIAKLLNVIADYGVSMYRKGRSEGGQMLRQLAVGEITPSAYEDREQRDMTCKGRTRLSVH